jgi:hypothetical protein
MSSLEILISILLCTIFILLEPDIPVSSDQFLVIGLLKYWPYQITFANIEIIGIKFKKN